MKKEMNERRYEQGLVSVVTPVYNGEKHLGRYLKSVLGQTYPHLELILVDDGSEDETVKVAESYRERMEERGILYTIVRAEHNNASFALGKGLPLVKGEYLIWPDSDDVLEKESVEIRVNFLREHPEYQCVRSLSYYFDPETKERKAEDEKRGDLKNEELFWDILEAKTFVCCGCYMLRTRSFFEIYPDGQIPVYDLGQNFQMLLPFMYSHKCPTIEKELYGVAVRGGSHSRTKLTKEQTIKRYRDYELLADDIARICGITDKTSLKRIEKWKAKRRLRLAVQYEEHIEILKAWLWLTKLGEKNLVPVLKKIGWMWVRDTRLADKIYKAHLFWVGRPKTRSEMKDFIIHEEWKIYKGRKRKKLKGEPTIIASNCVGTLIYHDMNLPFRSPTINLMIEMNDFIKFVENLEWYLEQKIIECDGQGKSYPIGRLDDIQINFVHYQTFEDAVEKWELRKQRIDWENLFIIGCEKDGCTYETLQRFERLPYENKVIFTKQNYSEFSSAYYVKGFEKCKELGTVTSFKKQFLKRRYLDDFDYISFLNKCGRKKKCKSWFR